MGISRKQDRGGGRESFKMRRHLSLRRLFSSESQKSSYDALIVGAGPTGGAMACALAAKFPQFQIGVIDVRPLAAEKKPLDHPDFRVLALSPASKSLLEEMGVWERIQNSGRSAPYYDMRVWDASGPGSVSFSSAEANSENLGIVVENNILTNAVYDCLNEFDNVNVLAPDVVEEIVQKADPADPSPIDVTLQKAGDVSAKLLIGSDGANSAIRKMMGITRNVGWKYNQKAVVCSVKFGDSVFCSTAFQRFLPNGPIALLPMFDNFGSIVWSTTPGHADALVKMGEEEFFVELQRAFQGSFSQSNPISDFFSSNLESKVEIPEIESVAGPRASFPLQISQSYPYVKNRFALVGDAAHTTHPLAGQGFNLALSGVACLTRRLEAAVNGGEDIGSHMVLQDYQRERLIDNSFTLFGVDAIQKIFSVQYSPWVMARGAGMIAVDNLPFVKKLLVQKATNVTNAVTDHHT